MLNAISTRLRPSSQPPSTASSGVSAGSPSSSGQSSPEPPPAPPSHRHKQHLIRRVLQAPLGGNNQQGVSGASKAKAQTRAEHRDAQKAAAAAAAAAAMHNSNSVKDLVSSLSLRCLRLTHSLWPVRRCLSLDSTWAPSAGQGALNDLGRPLLCSKLLVFCGKRTRTTNICCVRYPSAEERALMSSKRAEFLTPVREGTRAEPTLNLS